MIAHILPSNVVPLAAQWAAIALTAGGGLVILKRHSRIVELTGWSAFGLGASAVVTMVGIAMLSPQAPGYSLSLSVDRQTSSPVAVDVCARYPSGAYTRTPDADHVLAVVVDGAQAGYRLTSQFSLAMNPGRHTLRVELLSRDHREFNPPVAVDSVVRVNSSGTSGSGASCPTG